jgi:hypothetical protein
MGQPSLTSNSSVSCDENSKERLDRGAALVTVSARGVERGMTSPEDPHFSKLGFKPCSDSSWPIFL